VKEAPVLNHPAITARNERKESSMNTITTLDKGSWIQLNKSLGARAAISLLLLLLTLVGLTICPVQADPILDQEYIAATGNTIIAARFNTAQTFTVGA
jgi:hypothetical protein